MGSSFIKYRGYGFWSADCFVERLAKESADVMEKRTNKETWQSDLASHWRLQASGAFGGWVHLNLDEFLIGEDRRDLLRDIVQGVIKDYPEDDPVRLTGNLLLSLLDGKLTTNAASPRDYMVGMV